MLPPLDLPTAKVAAAICVMTAGSAVQGAIGIGLALIAVPLLALIDVRFVPGPMLLAGIVVALGTAMRERRAIDSRSLTVSLAGLAAGTSFGVVALKAAAGAVALNRVFGALVLLAVALGVIGPKVGPTRGALLLGGGAAGVMGTMVGIHGPPISLVFQNAQPEFARAMLGAFFAVAYCATIVALAAAGLFGSVELELGLILLPGVAAGFLISPYLARLVNARHLRAAILVISVVSGTLLLVG